MACLLLVHQICWTSQLFGLDEVRGGSGYGAGTFAGATGARQPSQIELKQAEHQVSKMLPCQVLLAHFHGISVVSVSAYMPLSKTAPGVDADAA